MQKIQVLSALCTKTRLPRSDCQKCLSVCPAGAIELGHGTVKINSLCLGCEICVAVCPNGAFSISEAKERNKQVPDCLYCSKLIGDEIDMTGRFPAGVISCVASLSSPLLLQWALRIKKPLKVFTGACDQCVMERGVSHFRKVTDEVQSLSELFKISYQPFILQKGTEQDKAAGRKLYHAFKTAFEGEPDLERRNFLLKLSGPLSGGKKPQQKREAKKIDPMAFEKRVPDRLTTMMAVLRDNRDAFSPLDKILFYSGIKMEASCSGCGTCAALCPTGALTVKKTETQVHIEWTPSHCSQCNLCEEVCPEKALHLSPGIEVQKIVEESTSTIQSFYRSTCPDCQHEFLSLGAGACCPHCQKEKEVMEEYSFAIYGKL
jgi:energy-converting hydrogenase A subunit P